MSKEESGKEQTAAETKKQLCPYAAVGECRYGENCVYLHGDSCDMCGLQVLHPMDAAQRSQHIKVSPQGSALLVLVRLLQGAHPTGVEHSNRLGQPFPGFSSAARTPFPERNLRLLGSVTLPSAFPSHSW